MYGVSVRGVQIFGSGAVAAAPAVAATDTLPVTGMNILALIVLAGCLLVVGLTIVRWSRLRVTEMRHRFPRIGA